MIPYYENGTYYGFYLHDPRIRDKEYAEETTWHLIETKDFVNLDYKVNQLQEVVFMMPTRTHIQDRLSNVKKMDCIMFLYRL